MGKSSPVAARKRKVSASEVPGVNCKMEPAMLGRKRGRRGGGRGPLGE